jgi:hypothetical protein
MLTTIGLELATLNERSTMLGRRNAEGLMVILDPVYGNWADPLGHQLPNLRFDDVIWVFTSLGKV